MLSLPILEAVCMLNMPVYAKFLTRSTPRTSGMLGRLIGWCIGEYHSRAADRSDCTASERVLLMLHRGHRAELHATCKANPSIMQAAQSRNHLSCVLEGLEAPRVDSFVFCGPGPAIHIDMLHFEAKLDNGRRSLIGPCSALPPEPRPLPRFSGGVCRRWHPLWGIRRGSWPWQAGWQPCFAS